MKIKAVLNRDGGTFKTTDMKTYCEKAIHAFAARGHELDCTVVAGDEIVEALDRAAETPGIEAM
ncbi:MAG: diacylglycerol kinase family lipid kinase, partial [Alphaproteobacteria bacterium]|nr:diacylglycerol kinase family lipid kinase [Alphaproteobacteria bacterium]